MAYRFNEFFLSEFQAYVNKKIRNHFKRFQLATSHISDRKSFLRLRVHTFYDCGRKKEKFKTSVNCLRCLLIQ
jgi:hypothetical protein